MKKKLFAALGILAVAALVLTPVGCTPKKVQLQMQEQESQIQKSQERIAELQKTNEALTGNLNETKTALEGAKTETKQVSEKVSILNTRVSTLEARNVDLAKSVEAAKETEAESAKRIRSLTGQVNMLAKQKAEKEETIAVKENEIASLQTTQAGLKETVAAKDKQIADLNSEKTVLVEEMKKTVSGKNTTILILAILFGLAVVAAVYAFLRLRKPAPSL